MLVLTRKQNEKIKIGDDIVVSVLKIKGNTVRLGIAAPKNVRVVRGELPTSSAPRVKCVRVDRWEPTDCITERNLVRVRAKVTGSFRRNLSSRPVAEQTDRAVASRLANSKSNSVLCRVRLFLFRQTKSSPERLEIPPLDR